MTKLILATLGLLFANGVVIAQGQATALSDSDKADLIESVLDLELREQASVPEFANIRKLSSDNLEFIEPSRLSKRGFTLVGGNQLRESQSYGIVEYLVFRTIYSRNGAVLVVLSRVTEGQPCFGPAFSERSYTYKGQRTSVGWTVQLIRRPVPLISFWPKRVVTKRQELFIAPAARLTY